MKNFTFFDPGTQLLHLVSGAKVSNDVLSKRGNLSLGRIGVLFIKVCFQESKIHLNFRGA